MTKQLLSKIEGCYSSMSKGHKRITDYITENYDKAAFMTAAKLGDAVGVSESTVVRFASELGFSGYPQLQKTLQEVVKSRLTSVQRMEAAGGEDMLEHAFSSDIGNPRDHFARGFQRERRGDKPREAYLCPRRAQCGVACKLCGVLSQFCL